MFAENIGLEVPVMTSIEPKKLALLRIAQIFHKYSNPEHLLTYEDIANHLKSEYGIEIERKAVKRNISLLKEAGLEICSTRVGSYLEEREFTDAELRILIDGVLSSKHISARYSKDLIEKLVRLSDKYFRARVQYVHSVGEWNKTDNKELFFNIEMIDEAISRKKQITFDYNKYGADKKLHKTKTHTVSPYQLVLHNQRYYLMGRSEKWQNMGYYRLDRITGIAITDEKLAPITTIKGFEHGINYKEISTALPYMYTDEPQFVEFIADEAVIDQVIDWFGKDIRITRQSEDTLCVTVKVSPMAMHLWAMQYAEHVTVTKPQTLVEKIKATLKSATEKYER